MKGSRLLLSIVGAAALAACSGRAGDAVIGCGELGACAAGPPDPGCACIAVDASSVVDAPANAASSAPDAAPTAEASGDAGLADASVVDAVAEPAVVDASALQEAAPAVRDASPDASRGCYLQGYIFCPVDVWCPLGTCPDGITPYGCTCNPDGTTTCSLDCPS